MPTPAFQLCTFGAAHVLKRGADGAREIIPAIQSKHLAALTYVALSLGRSASRKVLSAYLWGDSRDKDQRHGLRASLVVLRSERGLGPEAFSSSDKESISLDVPVEIDCEVFESLVNAGRYEDAVAAYAGQFFANWSAPGADGFEEWALGKRNHYTSLFCTAARGAIAELLAAGRAASAIPIAERLRNETPESANSWSTLLETRLAARDRIRASADADVVEQLEQRDELEVDAHLRVLVRKCRAPIGAESAIGTASNEPIRAEMVGREREFNALLQEFDRAESARVLRVRIDAPPGFGKSRMLEEFAARLRSMPSRACRIVEIKGDAINQYMEFGLAARLAASLCASRGSSDISELAASVLVGLEPALSNTFRAAPSLLPQAHDAARIRASALTEVITAVADERRLVILADDLQWSDTISRQVISAALANVRGASVLFVSCIRSGHSLEMHADTEIALAPLSGLAIRELCESIAALPEEAWAEQLVDGLEQTANGSPFVILQTVEHLVDEEILSIDDDCWNCQRLEDLVSTIASRPIVESRIAARSADELLLLLVIGAAAGSLDTSAVRAAAEQLPNGAAALRGLELHGLIRHVGNRYLSAHDELLVEAKRRAGVAQWQRARFLVAECLRSRLPSDSESLREIGAHYFGAGRNDHALDAFKRFVTARRSHGDLTDAFRLAHEFVGDVDEATARRWVNSLPLAVRQPRLGRFVAAAAVSVMLVVGALTAYEATRLPPASEYAWLLMHDAAGHPTSAESIGIRPEDFRAGRHFTTGNRAQITFAQPQPLLTEVEVNPTNSRRWISTAAVADSGVTDLFLTENGVTKRLTFTPGDDVNPTWSPDGRLVVFASARWDSAGLTSLAILDPASGEVTRLTHADGASDRAPAWSPDGSTIAFQHFRPRDGSQFACKVATDTESERCVDLNLHTPDGELSWIDESTISVPTIGPHAVRRLVRVAPDSTLELSTLDSLAIPLRGGLTKGFVAHTNPDGDVISLALRERPGEQIQISLLKNGSLGGLVLGRGSAIGPGAIDTVVVRATRPAMAGVPHLLAARTVDSRGRDVHPNELRWTLPVLQASARISSDGVFIAGSAGDYRVRVTAGGWRSAEAIVRVVAQRDSAVSMEDWSGNVWDRWRRFGVPAPTIDTAGRGFLLNVNGEGTFFSGVYSRTTFRVDQGFAVEAEISTPITMGQGQLILFGTIPAISDSALSLWDHTTGWPQLAGSNECFFHFPGGSDGDTKAAFIQHAAGRSDAPRSLRNGKPFTVRLQFLPDGRCVTLLNQQVISVSKPVPHNDAPRRIYFYGSSLRTAIRVGRLRYFEGVLTDVPLTNTTEPSATRRDRPPP